MNRLAVTLDWNLQYSTYFDDAYFHRIWAYLVIRNVSFQLLKLTEIMENGPNFCCHVYQWLSPTLNGNTDL